jgi:hypothetical protein
LDVAPYKGPTPAPPPPPLRTHTNTTISPGRAASCHTRPQTLTPKSCHLPSIPTGMRPFKLHTTPLCSAPGPPPCQPCINSSRTPTLNIAATSLQPGPTPRSCRACSRPPHSRLPAARIHRQSHSIRSPHHLHAPHVRHFWIPNQSVPHNLDTFLPCPSPPRRSPASLPPCLPPSCPPLPRSPAPPGTAPGRA